MKTGLHHLSAYFNKSEAPVLLMVYTCCFVVVSYLAFQGLGNNYFWADEAETAFFTRALMKTGEISGWDERHVYTWRNGSLMRDDLSTVNPPIMYLLTAASFRLFGDDTAGGRFLHVVVGLGSLVALVALCRLRTGSTVFSLYSLLLVGMSISFLLYIRSVRYYSPALFFTTASLYAYHRTLKNISWWSILLLYALITGLFLTHYLIFISFLAALLTYHFLFFARKLSRVSYRKLLIAATPFLVFGIVHTIQNSLWVRDDYIGDPRSVRQTILRLLVNLRDLEFMVTLPGIVTVVGLIWSLTNKTNQFAKLFRQFALLAFVYIVVLSLFSLQTLPGIQTRWYADIRYLVPLIPIGALCTAALCTVIHSHAPPAAVLLLITILSTNLAALRLVEHSPRLYLPNYIQEIHHDYQGPFEAAVEFVRKNIPRGDTIVVVPEDYQPVMLYYLGEEYHFAGYLDEKSVVADTARKLSGSSFKNSKTPQWIAGFGLRSAQAWARVFETEKYTYTGDTVQSEPYWSIPVYYKDNSRPEIPYHRFKPLTRFDRSRDGIYFLRRHQR